MLEMVWRGCPTPSIVLSQHSCCFLLHLAPVTVASRCFADNWIAYLTMKQVLYHKVFPFPPRLIRHGWCQTSYDCPDYYDLSVEGIRDGVSRSGSGGYQQPEKKLYEGTALQAAWVDLRSFLKVCMSKHGNIHRMFQCWCKQVVAHQARSGTEQPSTASCSGSILWVDSLV